MVAGEGGRGAAVTDTDAGTPRVVSADDHIVEPPSLWIPRLPARFREVGPHVVGERVPASVEGMSHGLVSDPDGEWAEVWCYEDRREPQGMISAAVGFDPDDIENRPVTLDQVRPGCYDPVA